MHSIVTWVKDRATEVSSWSGGALIGAGVAILVLNGPLLQFVAFGAIAWGIFSVIKKN